MRNQLKSAKKSKQKNEFPIKFAAIAIIVFLIKVLISLNIDGKDVGSEQGIHFVQGIWLGADGENYLTAYKSLKSSGIFSKAYILNYWPAGYPIIIYLLSFLSSSLFLILLALLQSGLFSFAAYILAKNLYSTQLRAFSYSIFLVILLNPTLSLSSLAIGYESLVAAFMMISLACIVKDFSEKNDKNFLLLFTSSSLLYGLIGFMQPRLLATGVLVHLVWIILRREIRFRVLLFTISLLATLVFPATLVARNEVATNSFSISSNLGETMAVGAGPGANGTYKKRVLDIPCDRRGTIEEKDRQLVWCVIKWHLTNPLQSVELTIKKATYFWSPWTGALAFGTMARNPWVDFSPAIKIAAASNDGYRLVTGFFGLLISWIWLVLSVSLMFYGFLKMYSFNFNQRHIAIICMLIIVSQWVVTMVTIGDHRFRVPIMPLSLMFQVFALRSIFSFSDKKNKNKAFNQRN